MKKEKIIVICKFLPLPAYNGGAIRSLNWLKFLSKKYEIFLFGFQNQNFQDESVKLEEMLECKVYGFPIRFNILERIKCFLTFTPASIKKYYSGDLFGKLDEVIRKEQISKIFCSELCSSQYPLYRGLSFILDDHNIENKLMKDVFETSSNPLKKLYLRCESRFVKNFEIKAMQKCATIFVTSKIDETEALKYNNKVKVVYNTLPETQVKDLTLDDYPSLVFTGNMSRMPNKDGLLHFFKNILPKIMQQVPNLRVYLVGSQIPKALKKRVSDYIHYYENPNEERKNEIIQKAWIGVVPLYAGSGTRIKVIEYRSHEKPVVSTPKGVEGLDESMGTAVEVDDEAFAQRIIFLCQNLDIAKKMGRENFRLYEMHYRYDKVYKDKLYHELHFMNIAT